MPSVLLMENVPDLVGVNFVDQFNRWREKLEKLGYTNYVEILNAKDYGIPQNRRRCFMVSIYGDYAYEFPIPFKRKHDLKDLLDIEFDEKYILSEKRIKTFLAENTGKYKRKEAFLHCLDMARGGLSPTVTTRNGTRPIGNYVEVAVPSNKINGGGYEYLGVFDYKESDTFRPTLERRVHMGSEVSKTITTRSDSCCVIIRKAEKNEN